MSFSRSPSGIYAPLASPTFTGTPVLPTGTTGTTQTASDNSTKLATTAYADAARTQAANTYRTIFQAAGRFTTSAAGATKYFFAQPTTELTAVVITSTGSTFWFQFTAADYAISGLTTKLRVVCTLWVTTAPAQNVNVNLYPTTLAATTSLGTAVSGSLIAYGNPTANTGITANSGDFTIPGDGFYSVGHTVGGTPSGGGVMQAVVQVRNV